MPTKQQLDKAAWKWAETTQHDQVTSDHIRQAYRLNLASCKATACRRNCKGNPFCLNGLGERSWMDEIDESQWNDIEDPDKEKRQEGSLVGLKNLGATCYVNTFLQLWFHTPEFRTAVYKYKDVTNPEDCIVNDWSPSFLCDHLQVVFALLEFSKRRYIDPTPFIHHLGLDAGQQQDAQEFSKLFLSLLEDSFSQQEDATLKNVIKEQFCGEYAYVTRCNKCKNASLRPSKFYELDLNIKGHKTLQECIEEFLKKENLDGDNRYMCSTCNSKEDATREIQLLRLPPILNLQLLRFVFEIQTGHKKKLKTFIHFPETLNMTNYLATSDEEVLYNLSAVLIHRGPSAYSGHYIAHIQDPSNDFWFRVNDEETEKMKAKKLQLENDDEWTDISKHKIPKTSKGFQCSRNAYMLVYRRQEKAQPVETKIVPKIDISMLPINIQEYVLKDNAKFDDWLTEMSSMRKQNVHRGKETQEEMVKTYQSLQYNADCDSEWLDADWISKWLSDPSKVKPIDNKQYLCQHNKLNPFYASKLKVVSSEGANVLFGNYGVGPRLKMDSTCRLCVQHEYHLICTNIRIAEDKKFFAVALKTNSFRPDSFWVGKTSLRQWKRMAMKPLVEKGDTSSSHMSLSDGKVEEEENNIDGDPTQRDIDAEADLNGTEAGGMQFNEDLLCSPHKCLSPEMGCKRLIPSDVWTRLRVYFPLCPEFSNDSPVCKDCQALTMKQQLNQESAREVAGRQKNLFIDLYHDRNRPTLTNQSMTHFYLLSSEFVQEWRRFIKEPLRKLPVTDVGSRVLLCPHNQLLYQPDFSVTHTDNRYVCVSPEEWRNMSDTFNIDIEIKVTKVQNKTNSMSVEYEPDVCPECLYSRLAQEREDMFQYNDATIYVRKILKEGQPSNSLSGSEKDDPEFVQVPNSNKRKINGDYSPVPEKNPCMTDALIRRSQRHRRVRGEKTVSVSSKQTLKELKIQIMNLFSVAPFDQTLTMDGIVLKDDQATLGSLKVYAGSILMLTADEAVEDPSMLDDLISVPSSLEEGFKGTGLQST